MKGAQGPDGTGGEKVSVHSVIYVLSAHQAALTFPANELSVLVFFSRMFPIFAQFLIHVGHK